MPRCYSLLVLLLVTICFGAESAFARDAVEDFYRGKVVTIIVGSPAGGGYDIYARLVARRLGKHIPGSPSVVVQNMPGAGSAQAGAYIALKAHKDGTVIGAIESGAILEPLLFDGHLPYDPSKFVMLGSANKSVFLCLARADAPAREFGDLFDREMAIGTTGEAGSLRLLPTMLVNVLGVKLRLIGGYQSSREVILAMERKEVDGMCGMDWSSLVSQRSEWITTGSVHLLAQEDQEGNPIMNNMGVPLTTSFARSEESREVMDMIYSQNLFGRPYLVSPEVPADRAAALRLAFAETMEDATLLAEAKAARLEINPLGGEELQALVAHIYALPPNIIKRAKQSLIYAPAERR